MSTIHLHHTTTLTPEQYIAGLTDFGPGRSKLFGNSTDDYMKVHSLRIAEADLAKETKNSWDEALLTRAFFSPGLPPVHTENSVRSENAGVPTIREIMVATTMSSLFVAFSL